MTIEAISRMRAIASKWRRVMIAWRPRPQRISGRQHDDHGKAGVHRADHEVGREDALLPARHQAGGEVEADDRMHGADQRHAERGHRGVQRLQPRPCARRAAPAQRERAVEQLARAVRRAVAHGREVRDQADIAEQDREQQVADDRPEIPHQRAAPLRPQRHRVRIGCEPVDIDRPAEMEDRA